MEGFSFCLLFLGPESSPPLKKKKKKTLRKLLVYIFNVNVRPALLTPVTFIFNDLSLIMKRKPLQRAEGIQALKNGLGS